MQDSPVKKAFWYQWFIFMKNKYQCISFNICFCWNLWNTLWFLFLRNHCYLSIFILLNFYYHLFIQWNIEKHLYLTNFFSIMRRFQQNLFYSVYYWHQIVLKHKGINTPFTFVWRWLRNLTLTCWILLINLPNTMFSRIKVRFRLHCILHMKERLSWDSLIKMFRVNLIYWSFAILLTVRRNHLRKIWIVVFLFLWIGSWIVFLVSMW